MHDTAVGTHIIPKSVRPPERGSVVFPRHTSVEATTMGNVSLVCRISSMDLAGHKSLSPDASVPLDPLQRFPPSWFWAPPRYRPFPLPLRRSFQDPGGSHYCAHKWVAVPVHLFCRRKFQSSSIETGMLGRLLMPLAYWAFCFGK